MNLSSDPMNTVGLLPGQTASWTETIEDSLAAKPAYSQLPLEVQNRILEVSKRQWSYTYSIDSNGNYTIERVANILSRSDSVVPAVEIISRIVETNNQTRHYNSFGQLKRTENFEPLSGSTQTGVPLFITSQADVGDTSRQRIVDSLISQGAQVDDLGSEIVVTKSFTEVSGTFTVSQTLRRENLEPIRSIVKTEGVEIYRIEYRVANISGYRVVDRTVEYMHTVLPSQFSESFRALINIPSVDEMFQSTSIRTTTYSNIVLP